MSNGTSVATFGPRGIQLQSMSEAKALAETIVASGLAPKGMDKPATVLVALQMGAELGLAPMASLQNIAVINGRPSIWGDAMLAICQQSTLFDFDAFEERLDGEGDKRTATCTVRRLPNGKPATRTFSVGDAKRAKLWGKSGPWSDYPDRMLQMRARTFALRDTFADVLRGFTTIEEARDMTPIAPQQRPKMTPVTELLEVKSDGEIIERSDEDTPQPARRDEPFTLGVNN